MNNSIETDHASTPLGIFASELTPDVGIVMPTYFDFASKPVSLSDWQIRPTSKNFPSKSVSHKTNIGGVGTPPYVARPQFRNAALRLATKKVAFTLAEVLITLGIIGVVATLTLPTVINKVQSVILKNQFKKAYSSLLNAINLVQKDEPVACWYWDKKSYASAVCIKRNEYGTCIAWDNKLADGSPVPVDYSGNFSDCNAFYPNLRKTLKVVKYCEINALKNGCVTDDFRGVDKAKQNLSPDTEQDPGQHFSDSIAKYGE